MTGALVLVVDGQLAQHLTRAVAEHLTWCRRNGLTPPPELGALLESLTATGGHIRPPEAAYSVLSATSGDGGCVTYTEAAERLGVSHRTVRRHVERGALRTAGRRVLAVDVARLAGRERTEDVA